MNLHDYKAKLQWAKGQRDLIVETLETTTKSLEETESLQEKYMKVRSYVQIVAETTQKKVEYQISNLVSSALAAVFPNPYEFVLRFDKERNKTVANCIFRKNGNEGKPIDMSGGGALDVASFALRAARWALKPSRKILILDEPGKNLSRNLQPQFAQMLQMISGKLGIQIIISTHIPEIIEKADKVFTIKEGQVEST